MPIKPVTSNVSTGIKRTFSLFKKIKKQFTDDNMRTLE